MKLFAEGVLVGIIGGIAVSNLALIFYMAKKEENR